MKVVRLASLALGAILALSLTAASTASAIGPLFLPTGQTFTGTSGELELVSVAGEILKCESDVSSGTITSSTLAGNIVVHFLGCSGQTVSGEKCTVKSTNTTAEGLILTATLHGVLGLILPLPIRPESDVALVLLPASGHVFVTLVGSGKCFETAKISGTIAGLVLPVGTLQTTGKLLFSQSGGQASIRDVDLTTGGLVVPELTLGSTSAAIEAIESLTFSRATEVM